MNYLHFSTVCSFSATVIICILYYIVLYLVLPMMRNEVDPSNEEKPIIMGMIIFFVEQAKS